MPAKITAAAKRRAIAEAFGDLPGLDSQYLDFLYPRRHLATVPERGYRELAYVTECSELEQVLWRGLERIRQRDGLKTMKEVAERLATYLKLDVEIAEGKWDHLRSAGKRQ